MSHVKCNFRIYSFLHYKTEQLVKKSEKRQKIDVAPVAPETVIMQANQFLLFQSNTVNGRQKKSEYLATQYSVMKMQIFFHLLYRRSNSRIALINPSITN